MTRALLAIGVAVAIGSIGTATAQIYPSRPITMIVPFPAGGPNDTIGRIVTERMRGSLGQPVVIEKSSRSLLPRIGRELRVRGTSSI